MTVKKMSQIAVLAALCIVLRMAFGAFPNIKPVTAFFLVSLLYFDFWDSFLIMTLTMVGSSLIFGFSVVVLWQVLSFGLIMLVWRYIFLPVTNKMKSAILFQSILAGFLAFSYGFCISVPLAFQFGANLFVYWMNGIFFDLLHAISTTLFYPLIYQIFRRFYHDEKNNFTA